MRTYDLPHTRQALSIDFELLTTHEERGHILDLQLFWTLNVHKVFFCRCWRFENINFSARCRTINSSIDWKRLAENINRINSWSAVIEHDGREI